MKLNEYGYPRKNVIRYILNKKGIDTTNLVFSAMYNEGKRVGILWKTNYLKKELINIEYDLQKAGVKIKRIKREGSIHSIWFEQLEKIEPK